MDGFNLSEGVHQYVAHLERDNPELSMSARVKAAWNSIIEQGVKQHITAVFVVPNTQVHEVIIYVDSQIWATELSMQSDTLRVQLNIKLQEMNVSTQDARKYRHIPELTEQITKLTFKVSKEKYIRKAKQDTSFNQLLEEDQRRRVQPVALDEESLAQIQDATAGIENEALRLAAYRAATANLEWQKGLKEAKIS